MKAILSNGMMVFYKFEYNKILATLDSGGLTMVDETVCEIVNRDDPHNPRLICKAYVYRHHKDKPNKVIARKAAFTKAVSYLELKSDRFLLWQSFLSNVKIYA